MRQSTHSHSWTLFRLAKAIAASVTMGLILSACGSSSSTSPSSNPPAAGNPVSEALVAVDQTSVKLLKLSGTSTVVINTATIPGIPGTYSRAGNAVTVAMPNHGIRDGLWVDLQFAAGTGGTATSGQYKVAVVDENTFTVNDAASGVITDGSVTRKVINTLSGTYTQAGTVMTVTFANHGLESGDTVDLKFTSGGAAALNAYIDSSSDLNTFRVTTQVAATTSGNVSIGIGTNYIATDVRMHPSGKWVYVSSQYDCFNGSPYCWGGDLMSRFAINWDLGTLTFERSYRTSPSSSFAAPVAMAFSPDGTLLAHQDDDDDEMALWSVNTTNGDLTYRVLRCCTNLHGVAFGSGNTIYHGSSVFTYSTSPFEMTRTFSGDGLNSTIVSGATLFGATTSELRSYSLTTPTAPSLTARISTNSTNRARDLVVLNNGSRIVTSGFNGLMSYTVGTNTITAAVSATGSTVLIDGGTTTWPNPSASGAKRMYRSISADSSGQYLVATYFTNNGNNVAQGGIAPSGFVLVQLASDGSMTRLADVGGANYMRIARFIKKP